jgi:hypothetical protein
MLFRSQDSVQWATNFRQCMLNCVGQHLNQTEFLKLEGALSVGIIVGLLFNPAGFVSALLGFVANLGIDLAMAEGCPNACIESLGPPPQH